MSNCDDCNLIERLGEVVLTDEECEELLELVETNRAYNRNKRERENKKFTEKDLHELLKPLSDAFKELIKREVNK